MLARNYKVVKTTTHRKGVKMDNLSTLEKWLLAILVAIIVSSGSDC